MKHKISSAILFVLLCCLSCGSKPIWIFGLESRCYSDLVLDGDVVYVSTQAGEMIALKYKTGEKLWKIKVPGSFFGAPAFTSTRLFGLTQQGMLYSWDKTNGSTVWKQHFEDQFTGSLSAANDLLFFASVKGTVYGASQQDGHQVWSHTGDFEFITKPIVAGNLLFIGGWSSKLYCFKTDGTINWTFKTGYVMVQNAVVENNVVYFTAHDNFVYAVDVPSGKLLWRFSAFEPGNLIRLNDSLVFANRSGVVYFVQARSGKLQKKMDLKREIAQIYPWKGKCLVISKNVYALDPQNQKLQKLFSGRNPFFRLAIADSIFIISDDLYSIYGFQQ
jgi:outer membrane protein assembly factor BamB